MWLFVLCLDSSTDIKYQRQHLWHPIKIDKTMRTNFSVWILKTVNKLSKFLSYEDDLVMGVIGIFFQNNSCHTAWT
jgi:hypothetical protein